MASHRSCILRAIISISDNSSVKDLIIGDSVGIWVTEDGSTVDVVVGHVAVAQSVFDKASTFLIRIVVLK